MAERKQCEHEWDTGGLTHRCRYKVGHKCPHACRYRCDGVLCEALRIAVEAPVGLCCPECGWMWGESRDEYNGCEQCDESAARLAAVRELVDLP